MSGPTSPVWPMAMAGKTEWSESKRTDVPVAADESEARPEMRREPRRSCCYCCRWVAYDCANLLSRDKRVSLSSVGSIILADWSPDGWMAGSSADDQGQSIEVKSNATHLQRTTTVSRSQGRADFGESQIAKSAEGGLGGSAVYVRSGSGRSRRRGVPSMSRPFFDVGPVT